MARVPRRYIWIMTASATTAVAAAVALPATGWARNKASAAPTTTSPATAPSSAPATAPADAKAAAAPDKPATHVVRRGALAFEVKADGVLQAAECFELRPVFRAYGGAMTVQAAATHGKSVHKGDLLLSLDPTTIHWAITAAESELAAAQAALTKTESDQEVGAKMDALSLRGQEDAVRNAEATKQWFDSVDGPNFLESADLQAKQAKATVDDQNDELDQLRKMYKDDSLTSATADIVVKRAVRQLEQSKIGLKMQEDRREKVKTFEYPINKQRILDGIEGARHQLALLKSTLAQTAVNRRAAVTTAKVGVEQATRRVADLKDDLAFFTVKSPCDGIVEYGTIVEGQWMGGDPKSLRAGERLAPNGVLLRVFAPGRLKAVVPLPEAQAFWVEPGMTARITPIACPQFSRTAKCQAVESAPRGIPPTFGFQASFDLGETDRRLLPGMKASVQIDAGKLEDVLLVPVAAVTGGKVQVYGKNGKVKNRAVTVGRSDGTSVEVQSGLSEGDEVVLPGKK